MTLFWHKKIVKIVKIGPSFYLKIFKMAEIFFFLIINKLINLFPRLESLYFFRI